MRARKERCEIENTKSGKYREVLLKIQQDPRYQRNIEFGKPRRGHPEGTVRAHIAELERNAQSMRHKLSEEEYWKIMLLIHVHDSFKRDAERGVPISHPRSHASLAADFLREFCNESDLIQMVQLHDEPYALFRQAEQGGGYNVQRFNDLLRGIKDWDLFLAFNIVDGCTAGKERSTLYWLFGEINGRISSRFSAEDIL